MKNRITILALCACLIAGITAQAQEVKVVTDGQNVAFSDIITPDTLGICFVVKKGESIDDNSKVYALKNEKSDSDGRIKFSFVMPETKNDEISDGEYEIYIKESGKAIKKAEFIYASLATRNGVLSDVKAVPQDSTKVQELKSILENPAYLTALKAIGCETDYYNEKTAANMCEEIADFSTVTQAAFRKAYNTASVKETFPGADKAKADELLSVISPEFEGTMYDEITDKKLTDWLSSYFAKGTYSDKKYEEANILYKFNNTVADKIDDLFEQYDDTTDITNDTRYIEYNKITSKAKVNIEIAEALAATPVKTVDSLLDIVAKSVKAVNTQKPAGGAGGGGGGGGAMPPKDSSIISGVPTDSQPVGDIAHSFNDMNKAEWARTAVASLVKAGIVAGDGDGNFRPNDHISREEYIKMLVLAAGKYNENAMCEFEDVSKDAWYYSYVASAKEFGLTSGISEDEFGIGRALTRQDMAVLSLKAKGEVQKVRDNIDFADGGEIAPYAKEAVSKLYMSGAVSGTGNNMFAPLGVATRAECAQIIYNLFLK